MGKKIYIFVNMKVTIFSSTSEYLLFFIVLHVVNRISANLYSDQFVVKVSGGAETAKQLAKDHDFEYLGEVNITHKIL